MVQTEGEQPVSDTGPKGIGGWLLLPLVQLIAAPIAAVFVLIAHSRGLNVHAIAIDQIPLIHEPVVLVLTIAAALLLAAMFGLGLYCLVRFLQERREVPRLMTIWYELAIAMNVLAAVLYALYPEFYAKSIDPAAGSLVIGIRVTTIVILNGILIAYFATSRRVKNTFVRAAAPTQSLNGFGGWLLVALILTGFWILGASVTFATGHLVAKTIYAYQHGHTLALVRNFVGLALIALSVFSIVRVVERKSEARVLLAVLSAGIVADVVLSIAAEGRVIGGPLFAAAIWAGIAVYFLTSKRVKNTFVR